MELYVCGLFYEKPIPTDRFKREFGMVKPTGCQPYVARSRRSAADLHNLCKHHSHLYQIEPDGTINRIVDGEPGYLGPVSWQLTPTLLASVVGRDDWLSGESRALSNS
jgi:hypothetical protein